MSDERKTGHTPPPWKAQMLAIYAPSGEMIGQLGCSNNFRPPRPDECVANAAYIVECVNSHAALVAALEEALSWLKEIKPRTAQLEAHERKCRAALAAARGNGNG